MSICFASGILGKPTVLAFRSEIMELGGGYRLIRPLIRLSLRFTSAIVCQSNEARDSMVKLFPHTEPKLYVIPNWIDLAESDPLPQNSQSKSDLIHITYIGWLEPIKDVSTILRALVIVNKAIPKWQLSICGSGSERKSLEQLARKLGIESKIDFRGWIGTEEKESILRKTDIFAMASLSEGMPNSILEAMKFGIPIVATKVGGIPTLVNPGENGFLFQPKNESQMAGHLQALLSDPQLRTTVGNSNYRKIRSEHDVELAATRILGLLCSPQLKNCTP